MTHSILIVWSITATIRTAPAPQCSHTNSIPASVFQAQPVREGTGLFFARAAAEIARRHTRLTILRRLRNASVSRARTNRRSDGVAGDTAVRRREVSAEFE